MSTLVDAARDECDAEKEDHPLTEWVINDLGKWEPIDGFALLEHTDDVIMCHKKGECLGPHCTVHNRSDHVMRAFPQYWREDLGLMERTCPCSVGHPDPDAYWSKGDVKWVHGCCAKRHCIDQAKDEPDEGLA